MSPTPHFSLPTAQERLSLSREANISTAVCVAETSSRNPFYLVTLLLIFRGLPACAVAAAIGFVKLLRGRVNYWLPAAGLTETLTSPFVQQHWNPRPPSPDQSFATT